MDTASLVEAEKAGGSKVSTYKGSITNSVYTFPSMNALMKFKSSKAHIEAMMNVKTFYRSWKVERLTN